MAATDQVPFRTRRRGAASRRGLTLIEAMVTMAVLIIGILAMSSTFSVAHNLRATGGERALAVAAMENAVVGIKGFSTRTLASENEWSEAVIARYSPGGAVGSSVAVAGLDPVDDQQLPLSITVVRNETMTDAALGARMGMPRDLNGDGDALDTDVSADARLLPVIVQVRWRGRAGANDLARSFYLGRQR